MIDRIKDRKSEINQKSSEKMQRLDTISSFIGDIDTEQMKLQITRTVKALKTLEEIEISTSETQYIEKISSMSDLSVWTLKRIKKKSLSRKVEHSRKKRPHCATFSNLDNIDVLFEILH